MVDGMKIGFIGLGRMGKNIVLHLLEEGIQVVAWNRSPEPRKELEKEAKQLKSGYRNLKIVETTSELVKNLEKQRVIWLMVTAGKAVDLVIGDLENKLDVGDLIVDGGNSFYLETLKRGKRLSKLGIHFMDVGTSGGVESARSGACLMVGGTKDDYKRVLPILQAQAAPSAYGLLGSVGSGHFAKMIHNGIEYGMMEAIAEGATILKNSQFNYDLREIFRIYSIRSVIESRLVSWILNEFRNDQDLSNFSSVIGSGGGSGKAKAEGHWTVKIAKRMGFNVPVIKESVKIRDRSDKDSENSPSGYRNKVVAAMRWQFGRHPVKKITNN